MWKTTLGPSSRWLGSCLSSTRSKISGDFQPENPLSRIFPVKYLSIFHIVQSRIITICAYENICTIPGNRISMNSPTPPRSWPRRHEENAIIFRTIVIDDPAQSSSCTGTGPREGVCVRQWRVRKLWRRFPDRFCRDVWRYAYATGRFNAAERTTRGKCARHDERHLFDSPNKWKTKTTQ